MELKKALLLLVVMLVPGFMNAQTVPISGKVFDLITREPLVGVNVVVAGKNYGTSTGIDGQFSLEIKETGPVILEFSMVGYEKAHKELKKISVHVENLLVYLKRTTIEIPEISISPGHFGVNRKIDKADKFLAIDEIKTTPGTMGDLFMTFATLPGVTSIGPTAAIFVQGGRQDENLVLLDHGTIKSAFHMEMAEGGIYSILNPEILREVNLYSGGFGAEYGNKLSSVLIAKTRNGDFHKYHTSASLSNTFAEVFAEGPLPLTKNKGSFLLSARRSYFDLIIDLTEYSENFAVFPNYMDFTGKVSLKLSSKHKLDILGIYANDDAIFRVTGDFSDVTGNSKWNSSKYLTSVSLRSFLNDNLISRLVFSANSAIINEEMVDLWYKKNNNKSLSVREDLIYIQPEKHRIKAGIEFYKNYVKLHELTPEIYDSQDRVRPGMDTDFLDIQFGDAFFGGYLADVWTINPFFSLEGGIRADYSFHTNEFVLLPRLSGLYRLNKKNVLHASWGYYSQFPPLFETDKVYGNPDLSARKATHYILSVETETVKNISIKLENFYKTYHNLPLEDDIKSYTNKGEGYAYGLGLLIQRRNSEKLNGWLSYSYTRSMRKEYEQKSIYRPDFDVPHRVSVVATYNLPGNWQLGMKWLYSTGRPYTPIVNSYKDSISGYYVPVFGKINSKRLPDYHTLEFRGLKKWTFENWNLTVFIEVMNLYNHMNIAEYKWNEDYTERSEMQYYPLIPSIGVIARL